MAYALLENHVVDQSKCAGSLRQPLNAGNMRRAVLAPAFVEEDLCYCGNIAIICQSLLDHRGRMDCTRDLPGAKGQRRVKASNDAAPASI